MAAGEAARDFHERTKHTFESIRRAGRMLNWETKPLPFKQYGALPAVQLPDELPRSEVSMLDALVRRGSGASVDLPALARILTYGAGVLRKRAYGPDTLYFRTYASAGALYPVELYVICGGIAGLEDGVHHFDPLGMRPVQLAGAPGADGACLVFTGIPWRTCWKYGERGYRHLFWDAGTILAGVTALASSSGVSARIEMGFDDDVCAAAVGADGTREFPVCVVSLTERPVPVPVEQPVPDGLPPAAGEERFALLDGVNRAGKLSAADVQAWRGPIESPPEIASSSAGGPRVEEVIRVRGSARAFGSRAMGAEDVKTMIERATAGVIVDYSPGWTSRVQPFVAVHNVEGLEPGTYVWENGELEALRRGDVRLDSAYLCLEQRLGGTGAATLFLMLDLDEALSTFGNRGYRVAQLEGGLLLGRLNLAAQALGWGATGLTFYDDDVTTFFSPRAAGLSCIVVCAVGERRGRALPLA